MSFIKRAIKKWICKECSITDVSQFCGQQEFDELKKTILVWTENKTRDEQLILLDYVVDMLKEDLCSGNAAKVLMQPFSSPFFNFIPTSYEDRNGKRCSILCNEKQRVDLTKAYLYLCPWKKEKIPNNLFRLKQDSFRFDSDNHKSHYYTDIDLCHVYNGNHSIHIGAYLKKGEIESDVCRTEMLYPHCYTDGKYWYNSHTGKIISKVDDFRIAALYYAAQIRYKLKSGENINDSPLGNGRNDYI